MCVRIQYRRGCVFVCESQQTCKQACEHSKCVMKNRASKYAQRSKNRASKYEQLQTSRGKGQAQVPMWEQNSDDDFSNCTRSHGFDEPEVDDSEAVASVARKRKRGLSNATDKKCRSRCMDGAM